LFAGNDGWPHSLDEPEHFRPKVSVIGNAALLAGDTEGLARRRPSPNRPVIRPTSQAAGKRPATDPGEEMALSKSSDISSRNIDN
jgi:hypothetical protein